MAQQPIKQLCNIPTNGRLQHFFTKKKVPSRHMSVQSQRLLQMPHLKASSKSLLLFVVY
jgi:hypothetical protein